VHLREWLASCVGADFVGLADSARSRFASVMMCHFEMMASSSLWSHDPENHYLGLECRMFLNARFFTVRFLSIIFSYIVYYMKYVDS
jgi:hypothetical protein